MGSDLDKEKINISECNKNTDRLRQIVEQVSGTGGEFLGAPWWYAEVAKWAADEIDRLRDYIIRHPEWQPIDDDTPRDGTEILAIEPDGVQSVGKFLECGNFVFSFSLDHSYPTHWMPLPAPPEEDNEDENGS